MSVVYVDTSVLANRYLRSPISESVDALFDDPSLSFAMSELCLVEMESALARHRRERLLSAKEAAVLRHRFEDDIRLSFFTLHPLSPATLLGARALIQRDAAPLATLDSLHLCTAIDMAADAFATDDRQLKRAAKRYGLAVIDL